MNPPVRSFIHGFTQAYAGVGLLLASRRLKVLAIIPLLIGLAFLVLGFFLSKNYFFPWIEDYWQGSSWLENLGWVSHIIGAVLFLFSWMAIGLLNFLLTYLLVMIFAGPFYGLMAEAIFDKYDQTYTQTQSLRLVVRMVLWGLLKASFFIILAIVCMIMSFFPPLNLLAAFIVFMVVTYDLSDYSFEVDGVGLLAGFAFILSHFWHYLGFASAIYLTAIIPGSFFILLPGFICGATQMYLSLKSSSH
jgi:CysZ protein